MSFDFCPLPCGESGRRSRTGEGSFWPRLSDATLELGDKLPFVLDELGDDLIGRSLRDRTSFNRSSSIMQTLSTSPVPVVLTCRAAGTGFSTTSVPRS